MNYCFVFFLTCEHVASYSSLPQTDYLLPVSVSSLNLLRPQTLLISPFRDPLPPCFCFVSCPISVIFYFTFALLSWIHTKDERMSTTMSELRLRVHVTSSCCSEPVPTFSAFIRGVISWVAVWLCTLYSPHHDMPSVFSLWRGLKVTWSVNNGTAIISLSMLLVIDYQSERVVVVKLTSCVYMPFARSCDPGAAAHDHRQATAVCYHRGRTHIRRHDV